MVSAAHCIQCILRKFLISCNCWLFFLLLDLFLIDFATHDRFHVHIGKAHLMIYQAAELGAETLVVPLVVKSSAVVYRDIVRVFLTWVEVSRAKAIVVSWSRKEFLLRIVLILGIESC